MGGGEHIQIVEQNGGLLTFGRTVDDLMLLLGVFEDTLGAEHFLVVQAVELYLLGGVLLAELNGSLLNDHLLWIGGRCHGQTSQHLVVHWQIVN